MVSRSFLARPAALAALVAAATLFATPARADDPVSMANACKAAVQALVANNYNFRAQPNPRAVRSGATLSFADAYSRFSTATSACRPLLAEPNAYVPSARQTDLAALVVRHREAVRGLAFANNAGYLDAAAGLLPAGRRILEECPGNHLGYFNCDSGGTQITTVAALLTEYMDFVITANQAAPAAAFPISGGFTFAQGARISSAGGTHYLVFQTDGNLVVYTAANQFVWGLDRVDPDWRTNTRLVMQGDGNLVSYSGTRPTWATGTQGNEGARLTLRDDGVLTIQARDGRTLWTSR